MPDMFTGNMHKHKCTGISLKTMTGIFTQNTNKGIPLKREGRPTFDL